MSLISPTKVLEILKELFQNIEQSEQQSKIPYTSPQDLVEHLDLQLGSPSPEADFIAAVKAVVEHTPNSNRFDFANQLFGGREGAAVLGEALTAFLNISTYTYKVAAAQIFIEKTLIAKLLHAAGLHEGEGLFVPGGSIANLSAMLVARHTRFPESKEAGLSQLPPLAIYSSEVGHYSIPKNANIMGLGRSCVRNIPTDSEGRMSVAALEAAITEDRNRQIVPFFINATAGTTVIGAFDPIEEIAAVAKKYGVWLHVDGAYGASVLLSRRTRDLLTGSELIDSMSWNAHKMLGVPLHCSVALFKAKGGQQRIFSEQPEYLFQTDLAFNPGDAVIQCGRRNDAFKLWALWKLLGDAGLENRINQQFANTTYLAELIQKHPHFTLRYEPKLLNVCFQLKGVDSPKLCEKLDQMGLGKVGYGTHKGETFIRFVCVNPELTHQDMEAILDRILIAGRTLASIPEPIK